MKLALTWMRAIGRGMRFLIVLQHVGLKGHVKTSSKYYYVNITNWEDIYKDKKVELIISGHAHNNQRFPKNADGNIYLTVGTGGAEFTGLQSTSGLSKYFKNKHGYLMLENIGQESLNIRLDKTGIEQVHLRSRQTDKYPGMRRDRRKFC